MPRFNLSRLEDELPGELENKYRQAYLKQDIRQAVISMVILMIPMLAFTVNDFFFFETGSMFFFLLSGRIVFAIYTISLIIYLWNVKSPQKYTWHIFFWVLIGMVMLNIVNYTRPAPYTGYAIVDMVIILLVYFGIPNRLILWITTAFLHSFSTIFLILFVQEGLSLVTIYTIILSLVLVNTGGILITRRMNYYKRNQFLANFELDELASKDSLTGIYNRRMFIELTEKELIRQKRYNDPFTLLIIDIDEFKKVNDTYGHLEGDEVLKRFVDLVNSQIRKSDLFGRIGGEEFCVLLIKTSLKEAAEIAARIHKKCREIEIVTRNGKTVKFTVSTGITQVQKTDVNLDQIMRRADIALYRAKEGGRDRLEKFE